MNPNVTLVEVPQLLGRSCVCLFFVRPKKGHQNKDHPTIGSLRDFPALLAFIGAKNKLATLKQQLLNPMKTVMLGCIEGAKVKTNIKNKTQIYNL